MGTYRMRSSQLLTTVAAIVAAATLAACSAAPAGTGSRASGPASAAGERTVARVAARVEADHWAGTGDGRFDPEQGSVENTGGPLDVAIMGPGLIRVASAAGVAGYTRNGALHCDARGDLVVGPAGGCRVDPPINIPGGANGLTVSQDGAVTYVVAGGNRCRVAGQLRLCQFANPRGLKPVGNGVYAETEASGPPLVGNPGDNGSGQIQQGYRETSPDESAEEFAAWVRARRG